MPKRTKKKDIHMAFIQPMIASILMAVSIPLVTFAATGVSSSQSSFVPHSLFDAVQFRKAQRMRHDLRGSSSSAAQASSSSSASSVPAMMRYDDLTGSQKAELQKQLRIGACPYDVTPEYRLLCETMLRLRRHGSSASSLPQGLRNPRQP